ncbi:zinc finger protein 853-like [Morone saxatilis]|uniref:zinc finger protein 853-like n=1 Tax=Morone saxatilis TaxID=34816 RepID=UPI0015E244A2|nr:zinc finger protein 853-like [Morone saxatilis]
MENPESPNPTKAQPRFRILKRKPEDAQKKGATPQVAPLKELQRPATPKQTRAKHLVCRVGAPIMDVKIPSPYITDIDFVRGPVQNKTLWTPQSTYGAPPSQHTSQMKDFERGPVQHKKLWTAPRPHHAPAKQLPAGRVQACQRVEESPQQATKEPQHTTKEPQHTAELTAMNEGLASLLKQLQKTEGKASGGLAPPQEGMICISELQLHELTERKADLEAEVEQLKIMLGSSKALNEDAELKKLNTIAELELELSAKKAGEAEALSRAQQLEEELQREKEGRKECDVALAKVSEHNNALMVAQLQGQSELEKKQLQWQEERSTLQALHREAELKKSSQLEEQELELSTKKAEEAKALCRAQQLEEELQREKKECEERDMALTKITEQNNALMATQLQMQSELEKQQLQWQEERSTLLQSFVSIQQTLQEEQKKWEDLQEMLKLAEKKPKKPSMWRRFLRLFK